MTETRTTVREHESELVVEKVERVADAVVALTLVDPDGGSLPPWTPGAHVDLQLGDLVRQYSLCGDPGDSRSYTVAVLREPESRGGSAFVHDKLVAGGRVLVRGPRNHFALVSAPRYVFIAGGIGVTPMLPMIAEAEATGADWHLWYRGRARSGMAYADALAGYGERVTLLPGDETGPLDLASVLAEPAEGTAIYVCGPERLLAGCEEICSSSWPASALHLERFAAKDIEAPEGGEREFELELAASGVTLTVPVDRSVFQVIEDAGISVLGSCHEGICGTCEAIVLEGDVDHRDSVLNESERAANDAMMVCVSRCFSDRLALDL
jgi:ferredoxin-NADP reductase